MGVASLFTHIFSYADSKLIALSCKYTLEDALLITFVHSVVTLEEPICPTPTTEAMTTEAITTTTMPTPSVTTTTKPPPDIKLWSGKYGSHNVIDNRGNGIAGRGRGS